jgi:Uma2 family endonuclease
MATDAFQREKATRKIEYATSDGKPMAETLWHRIVMMALIQMLDRWFADRREVYVAGNMLVYYVPGNKRKHVSPDVFVVFGVPKKLRGCFLVWEEGKAPTVVIEVTSKTTKQEGLKTKMALYQDVLKVKEYFLFDPLGDYLKPRLQGYWLDKGVLAPIAALEGRLPSNILGLHLEAESTNLRLYDPGSGTWLPTLEERVEREHERAERESTGGRTAAAEATISKRSRDQK